MKTIQEIIKSKPVYLHDWEKTKKLGVISDFEDIYDGYEVYNQKYCPPNKSAEFWKERKEEIVKANKEWRDVKILFAVYTCECYEGSAFVLFSRKGKLFEVYGSHCSYNGLEGQWTPEECNIKELRKRAYKDYNFDDCRPELLKFLGLSSQPNKTGEDIKNSHAEEK